MKDKLPENFDWKTYIFINEDLKDFNEDEAINHYINYAISENRRFQLIDMNNKNIVLITSKIYVSEKKFSYTNNRSIYTPKERFDQTIETIISIKCYIPNTYIILFDNSNFNECEYNILNKLSDHFINIKDNDFLNFYTNEYEYKAFADISQQLIFYEKFFKFVDTKSFNHFFKISGRYIINSSFNFDNYNNDNIIFKKNKDVKDRDYYYTCFYKLNNVIITEYFNKIKILIDKKELYENDYSDLEVILPNLFIDKIKLIENLGITEKIAVFNHIEYI